jgi:hypothetical protein
VGSIPTEPTVGQRTEGRPRRSQEGSSDKRGTFGAARLINARWPH